MTVNVCRHLVDCMRKDAFSPLWTEYYRAISDHSPRFEAVRAKFEKIAAELSEGDCREALTLWAVYAKTMEGLYGCLMRLYEAKKARDGEDRAESLRLLSLAANEISEILEYRERVETKDFENWYRGDTKLDLPRLLREIRAAEKDLSL